MNEPFDDIFDFDEEEDGDEVEKAKSKMIMDFGLKQDRPERITIEVLQQIIKENPEKMCIAARRWLHPGSPER